MTGKMYFTQRPYANGHGHRAAWRRHHDHEHVATQTTDMLMPQQHMYMEFKADQAMAHRPEWCPASSPSAIPAILAPAMRERPARTWRRAGKWSHLRSLAGHAQERQSVSNVWIDQKLHFPIKSGPRRFNLGADQYSRKANLTPASSQFLPDTARWIWVAWCRACSRLRSNSFWLGPAEAAQTCRQFPIAKPSPELIVFFPGCD